MTKEIRECIEQKEKVMTEEGVSDHKQIKKFSTLELIEELLTRPGIEHGASGLYKEYDLTRKYTNRESHIKADKVLVVRDLQMFKS